MKTPEQLKGAIKNIAKDKRLKPHIWGCFFVLNNDKEFTYATTPI